MRAPGMPEPRAPEAVLRELVGMQPGAEEAVLQRLLAAPKMRNVWQALRQRKMTDDELCEFIAFACQSATVELLVMNRRQREASANTCATIAQVCQNERGNIRVQNDPELAAALARVAQHYAMLAREANPPDAPHMVGNSTQHDQDRVYVRLLVHKLRHLLGERLGVGERRLEKTIATVASVAWGHEITPRQVRNWCTE
jgi:hypothetical protein